MTVLPDTRSSARRDTLPVWVLVLLAVFLVLRVVEVVRLGHGSPSVPSASGGIDTDSMGALMQADLLAKTAFTADTKSLADPKSAVHPDAELLRQALQSAEKLQQETSNSPGAARRVLLLRFLLQYADGQGQNATPPLAVKKGLDPLSAFSSALPKEIASADRASYAAEGRLWQTLFEGGALSPKQIAAASAQIRHLPNLRWWTYPALMALYAGQGDKSEAARLARTAQADALPPLLAFLSLGVVRFGLILLGAVLLLYFLARRVQNAGNPEKSAVPDALWPTVPDPMTDSEKKLGAGDLFAVFVVYLLTRDLLSLLLSGAHFKYGLHVPGLLDPLLPRLQSLPAPERATINIVLEAIVYVLSAVPPIVYLWSMARRRGASLADEIGWTGRPFGINLLYGLGGYGVATVLMALVLLAAPHVLRNAPAPSNPVIPQLINAHGFWTLALLTGLASVAAPLVEELLFRGVFYRAARLKMGAWPAIVLTGAVFGFVHPVGVVEMLAIAMLGGTFAWMAETRKSLLPSIFAHCLNNLTVTLMLLLIVSG